MGRCLKPGDNLDPVREAAPGQVGVVRHDWAPAMGGPEHRGMLVVAADYPTAWCLSRLLQNGQPVGEAWYEARDWTLIAASKGLLLDLPAGTKVLVLQRRERWSRVLVLEGEHRNRLVWAPAGLVGPLREEKPTRRGPTT
jgi:hypothetical protein